MKQTIPDTNVILRFLIDGDKTFVELVNKGGVWLCMPVFLELFFVMRNHYKYPKEVIFDSLMKMLLNNKIVADKDLLTRMLVVFNNNPNLSLVDCYLVVMAEDKENRIETFDKGLKKVISNFK